MNLLLNPYLILSGVLFWVASCAGSAWLGYDYRDGKVAQQLARAQAETLKRAERQAAADLQAAIVRVRSEALAQERSRAAKTAGVQDAIQKARPDCARDAQSLGLLNAAIGVANGDAGGTRGLSETLPEAARSGER